MRTSASVALTALAALFLLAACGRVGAPLPPIIRIPERIENLSAAQSGYTVFLNWTSPSKYIDGNSAADLGMVHVFRNNVEIGTAPATAAGQPQSFSVDVRNSVGSSMTFTIQLVVPRADKPSLVSNPAQILPVPVPGSPRNPQFTVDKGRIVFTWDPPEINAALVEAYVVQRSDKPGSPAVVHVPRVDDEAEHGKTYTYTVTAVRGTNPQISGDGPLTRTLVAADIAPPAIPSGFDIQSLGPGNGVFLTWTANTEPDLKGYWILRSDGILLTTPINGIADPRYVPGMGLTYEILAEDRFGNQSKRSTPKPGP